MALTSPVSAPLLALGPHRYDVVSRALVMGVVDHAERSAGEHPARSSLDLLLASAEAAALAGADLFEVSGRAPGIRGQLSEPEELDRAASVVAALRERFDLPISVSTARARVAQACFAAGAVMGNDSSGFVDPDYLPVVAHAGASVVAGAGTSTATGEVGTEAELPLLADRLAALVEATLAVGIAPERVVVDLGLDLRRIPSSELGWFHSSADLAGQGWTLMLSIPPEGLAELQGDAGRELSLAACALGLLGGFRVLRVRDVPAVAIVRDALDAMLSAA